VYYYSVLLELARNDLLAITPAHGREARKREQFYLLTVVQGEHHHGAVRDGGVDVVMLRRRVCIAPASASTPAASASTSTSTSTCISPASATAAPASAPTPAPAPATAFAVRFPRYRRRRERR
jgi:hypothetical protein